MTTTNAPASPAAVAAPARGVGWKSCTALVIPAIALALGRFAQGLVPLAIYAVMPFVHTPFGGRSQDLARSSFWLSWNSILYAIGGTMGAVVFGNLSDRLGRRPLVVAAIVLYGIPCALIYFATSPWQLALLNFFITAGVGGVWTAGATLIAEWFPPHGRSYAGAAFYGSILLTFCAQQFANSVEHLSKYLVIVGFCLVVLLIGAAIGLRESESWRLARGRKPPTGKISELVGSLSLFVRLLLAIVLTASGLAAFGAASYVWHTLEFLRLRPDPHSMHVLSYLWLIGLGSGMLLFGPLAEWLGRRGAFLFMHVAAAVLVPIVFHWAFSFTQMLWMMPALAFFTGGMLPGYAIYLPELFPQRIRATAVGACLGIGGLLAAPIWITLPIGFELIRSNLSLNAAAGIASLGIATLYVIGLLPLIFLAETVGILLEGEGENFTSTAMPPPLPQTVPNYLAPAILVTIFCCLPLGIPAIVFGAKANAYAKVGDYAAAIPASNRAWTWIVVSFLVGLAISVGWIALLFVAAALSR